MFRQFVSGSSSVPRLVVITVRDLVTMVAAGSMAAAVTGADIIITGTNQRLCRHGCVGGLHNVKAMLPVLGIRLICFRLDFEKSRLLQLLI